MPEKKKTEEAIKKRGKSILKRVIEFDDDERGGRRKRGLLERSKVFP